LQLRTWGGFLAAFGHPPVNSRIWRYRRMPLQSFLHVPVRSECPCDLFPVSINGFMHSANDCILSGHPSLLELCIGIRLDLNPFICTSDAALLYIPIMRCRNQSEKPWACYIASRYECEIFSNAPLKSTGTMHNEVFVTSAWATASFTVATVPNAEFPGIP
jgi:hypothetical protein